MKVGNLWFPTNNVMSQMWNGEEWLLCLTWKYLHVQWRKNKLNMESSVMVDWVCVTLE